MLERNMIMYEGQPGKYELCLTGWLVERSNAAYIYI